MARVTILSERETDRSWTFEAEIARDAGAIEPQRVSLRLAWADYDRWRPDGAAAPEVVAKAALEALIELPGIEVTQLRTIDPAIGRRRADDFDDRVRLLLPRG